LLATPSRVAHFLVHYLPAHASSPPAAHLQHACSTSPARPQHTSSPPAAHLPWHVPSPDCVARLDLGAARLAAGAL